MNTFILTIDVEPEDRVQPPGQRPDWVSLPIAIERLNYFRRRLSSSSGCEVNFSWFPRVDPQIAFVYGDAAWGIRRFSSEFRALEAERDAIGLHMHPFRWDDSDGSWISDYGDFEWVRHCLDIAFQGFRDTLQREPRMFRFGDRWMSNQGLDELERRGIEIDISLEPGTRGLKGMVPSERSTGELPDFRGVPHYPYQPDRRDYRKRPFLAGPRALWMLPVTTSSLPGSPFMARFLGTAPWVPLNLALRPDWIQPILDEGLRFRKLLVSVFRTGDLSEPQSFEAFEQNLDYLARHPCVGQWRFVTPPVWKRERGTPLPSNNHEGFATPPV